MKPSEDAEVHRTIEGDADLWRQAERLERLWPVLNRYLFALTHPDTGQDTLATLSVAQLRLCSLLFYDGQRPMSQVGDDLGVTVSAATQMADRLERTGLVERIHLPGHDRRTRYLQLTVLGTALMRERQESRTERAHEVLGRLPSGERRDIVEVLEALVEASRPTIRPLKSAGGGLPPNANE